MKILLLIQGQILQKNSVKPSFKEDTRDPIFLKPKSPVKRER